MSSRNDYAPTPGALKLKGAAGVTKKKKSKKSSSAKSTSASVNAASTSPAAEDKSKRAVLDDDQVVSGGDDENDDEKTIRQQQKQRQIVEDRRTEAERKYDEMRKKRLDQRLLKEGSKTHKERVEDFNKYLANLSEHHDMPRIGPG